MNKKLMLAVLLMMASMPAFAGATYFKCEPDAERPRGTTWSVVDSRPVYVEGEVVVIEALNGSVQAIQVTGTPTTRFNRAGGFKTTYPCRRVDTPL